MLNMLGELALWYPVLSFWFFYGQQVYHEAEYFYQYIDGILWSITSCPQL